MQQQQILKFFELICCDNDTTFEVSFVNIFKTFEQQAENANRVVEFIKQNVGVKCKGYWIFGGEYLPDAKDFYKDYRLPGHYSEEFDQQSYERDELIDLIRGSVIVDCEGFDQQSIKQFASEIYQKFDVEIEFVTNR